MFLIFFQPTAANAVGSQDIMLNCQFKRLALDSRLRGNDGCGHKRLKPNRGWAGESTALAALRLIDVEKTDFRTNSGLIQNRIKLVSDDFDVPAIQSKQARRGVAFPLFHISLDGKTGHGITPTFW
ncbi:MAG: hypothetical protein R3B84_20560 [Zavarzinella sp.]